LAHWSALRNQETEFMQWIQNHHLEWLRFPALSAAGGLWHGILPRFYVEDGNTRKPLNLGLNCGDPDQRVWDNRRRVMAAVGGRQAVFARQVHGNQIGVWDTQRQLQATDDHVYLQGDALVTNVPGAALFIQTADCQSVMVFDPVRRVVGNIHSGWRGSIRNIVGRTVQIMVDRFGSRPEHLIAGIGPSLGPCCAEFIHYRQEIPQAFWPYRREHDYFDFWRLSTDQLVQAGVPVAQISASGICSRCNPHLFYSYRREGKQAGRFAAVIQLTPE
jgi:polyphenol oxidase